MSLASAALAYAKAGRKVFPCAPRGKEPLISASHGGRGHHDATNDLVVVSNWWSFWPDANVGLSCAASGIVVIDIDPRNGGDEGWTSVIARPEADDMPTTREAATGGDGFHLYLNLPPIPDKATWRGKLATGVDLKVDGYVLAPPSVHPSGKIYRWLNSNPLADMPAWLLALCLHTDEGRPTYTSPPEALNRAPWFCRAALTRETERVGRAPRGERNATLNSAAFNLGGLIHLGLSYDVVEEHLLVAACTWNDLPLKEARKTIRSGLGGGMRKPRGIPER